MTEIVIIKTDDIVPQTLSERDIYFEKLREILDLDDVQLYELKNFVHKKKIIDPLDEIKLKQLSEYDVIFIVSSVSNTNRDTNRDSNESKCTLNVQFPEQVRYVFAKDLSYYLTGDMGYLYTEAPYVSMSIVGILVPSLISSTKPSKKDAPPSKKDEVRGGYDIKLSEQVLRRSAHIDYFYKQIFGDVRNDILRQNLTFLEDKYYIVFKDKKHANLILTLLLELYYWLDVCRYPFFIEYLLNEAPYRDTTFPRLNLFSDFHSNVLESTTDASALEKTGYEAYEIAYDYKMTKATLRDDMEANGLLREYYLLSSSSLSRGSERGNVNIAKFEEVLVKYHLQEQKQKFINEYVDEVRRKLAFSNINYGKYAEIYSRIFAYFSANPLQNLYYNVASIASADEMKNIDLFIKKLKEYKRWPWDKIIDDIRAGRYKKKNLALLETFIADKSGDMYLNNNGDEVICVHLYKLLHGAESVMEYASSDVINNTYFCRICGEAIGKKYFKPKISWEGERELGQHHVDDEIFLFTLKYVIGIIKSEVQFRQQPPDGHFSKMAKSVTNFILPDVKSLRKQLQMDKIASNDQKEEELKLYTVIYVYAFVLKLVFDNYEDVKLKSGTYGTAYNLKALLDTVTNIILQRQNITINKIERVKSQNIRNYLVAAYEELSSRLVTKVKSLNAQSYEYKMNDNIVQYLNKFFKIMDMPESLKVLEDVDFSKSYAFTDVNFHVKKSNIYDRTESLYYLTKYIALPHNLTPITKTGYTEYYAKYLEELRPYLKLEEDYLYMNSTFRKKKWFASEIIKKKRFEPIALDMDDFLTSKYVDELLSLNYGLTPKFHKHLFSTLVDSNEKKDRKCSICSIKFGETKDEKGLKEMVAKFRNLNNFYNLYFNECLRPTKENIFHVFNGNACSQCGIEKQFIINRDISFFDKYYADFMKKTSRIITDIKIKQMKPFVRPANTIFKKDSTVLSIFLDNTMNNFLMGPSVHLDKSVITKKDDYAEFWKNVGLYQINEFKNNKIVVNNSIRIQWLKYYSELLYRKYTAARNYKSISIVDPSMKKIMDSINLTFAPLSMFKAPIGLTLDETAEYYYDNFLHLILKMQSSISSSLSGTERGNRDFLYYILNIVIASEKDVSLPTAADRLRITSDFQDGAINEQEEVADQDVYANMDYDGENEEADT